MVAIARKPPKKNQEPAPDEMQYFLNYNQYSVLAASS